LASLDALATHPEPAPEWLASHPNTLLHPVHGGTGYALMPVTDQQVPSCAQAIEIFGAVGESCGSVTFTIDDRACTTKSISVGYDGTVFQSLPSDRSGCRQSRTHCDCVWHSWPGYFR
jgi:hypothetical protein